MREKEGNEKEREVLKASRHFINDPAKSEKSHFSVLSGAFIAKPPLKITKKTRITITGGQFWKKSKR